MKITFRQFVAVTVIVFLALASCHRVKGDNDESTLSSNIHINRFGDTIRIYRLKDTIFYSPSENGKFIHLFNLPERNMSFEQIMKKCGWDNLIYEEEFVGTVDNIYDDLGDSIPEQYIERLRPYLGKNVASYVMTFKYPDDSGDFLHLLVCKDNNKNVILWGLRVPANYLWQE